MPTVNKAFATAIKATKAEVKAKESHKRQLSRINSRKRGQLKVIEARTAGAIATKRANQEAAIAISQQREATRTQRIESPPRRSFTSKTGEAATNKVIQTATPSSDSNLIMTVIFMIVGLAVFYQLVTKADQFSGFVGSVGDFLHKLSSNAPLFQTVAK